MRPRSRHCCAVQPLWDLANTYTALHDPVAARQELLAAVSRRPQDPNSWERLGAFDLHQGAAAAALAELKAAVAWGATSPQAHTLVAKAQAELTAASARTAAAAKAAARKRRGH
jgi:predicted Zn-dependent protease